MLLLLKLPPIGTPLGLRKRWKRQRGTLQKPRRRGNLRKAVRVHSRCAFRRAVSVRCHLSVAWPHESVIAASLCAMMYTAHRPSSRGERAAATGTAETRPRSKKRMRHKVPGCLRRHVNDPESQFYLHGSSHRAWLIGAYLGTPVPNTTRIGTLPRALLRARSTSTGRAPVTSSWPGAYRKPQPSPTGL